MSKTKMKAETSSDLEQSLLSTEKLDRASPDIWPERNYPGIEYSVIEPTRSPEVPSLPQSIIPQELDKHDYTLIGRYSKLTAQELIVEVKQLQNLAYQLGLEEAKEMTRGKYLNILSSHKRRNL
ncbi:protein lin-52 homolog [Daphnia carinata]|uniref:protein lin-52 homolog n=1 Tax=Daphnia carinata TaxID=120202 RepID=UPI00257EAFC3|nr:protein lin-52 homolog [Daphnia carinata]